MTAYGTTLGATLSSRARGEVAQLLWGVLLPPSRVQTPFPSLTPTTIGSCANPLFLLYLEEAFYTGRPLLAYLHTYISGFLF